MYKDVSDNPSERVQKLVSDWREVLNDPDSTSKFFLGHTHRAWSSFARSSCIAALSRTAAHVYLAQGTDDHSVTSAATDVLYAELLAHGCDCTLDWVVGADHGFGIPSQPARDGQRDVFERIKACFSNAI